MLVAWSKHAAKSPWVRDEAATGRDRGCLLPILIDGGQPPLGFRQYQALDLSGWKGRAKDPRTKQLIDAVSAQLSGKPAVLDRRKRPLDWMQRRGVRIAALISVLIIAGALALALLWDGGNPWRNRPSKPVIALLPFTAAAQDPELGKLASQTRDSIAHTFSESGVPLRLLNAVPQSDETDVDFVIAGDLSRSGDKILATVRLGETAQGLTVYSHQFEAGREDVRDLPERIGAQMAGNFTTSSTMIALDRRRPLDPALLTDLLRDDFAGGDPLQAYQNAKRVAAKAPDFSTTQLSLAYSTAFVLVDLPREERAEAVAEARLAAERAIKLGPGFGDAYSPWCILRSETLMAECEDRLRAARRTDPDAPYVNTFLSALLRSVGRFDESVALAKLAHTHDIYVPTKIAWMLKAMEFEGNGGAAKELHQQAARWWPEYKPMFFRNRMYSLLERGDFEAILRLEQNVNVADFMPQYESSRALVAAVSSKSVPAGRKACPNIDAFYLNVRCMIALSILGDQDGAYAIANKLYPRRVGRTPAETERIWLDEPESISGEFITSPAAAPMRRDPRFLQLADRVGLLRYWRSGRPPDFCRTNPEPVCAQLLKRS